MKDLFRKASRRLVARLSEPSSWAGLAAIAATLGLTLDPGLVAKASAAGAALFGLLAFFLPESS